MLRKYYFANKALYDKILVLAGMFIFTFIFIKVIFYYVSPFVFAYIFSLALCPAVSFITKKAKIPRVISTAVMIVLSLGLIIFLLYIFVRRVGSEVRYLSDNIKDIEDMTVNFVNDLKTQYNNIISQVPIISEIAENMRGNFLDGLNDAVSASIKNISLRLTSILPKIIFNFFIFIISTFFFVYDKQKIAAAVKKHIPVWISKKYSIIKSGILNVTIGYIKSTIIIMTLVSTICITGLALIGFKYAFLIGVLAGIIDIFPVMGVGFFLWPLFAYFILAGKYSSAVGIIFTYLACHTTRQTLSPKIISMQIGLHPLVTIISIYIGLKLFGFIGILAGPLAAVISKIILSEI